MTALALCRFAHFMSAMLAFGASAYLWLYAPDNLRRALSPAIRRLTIAASLVALVSAIAWLSLQAASMADDWSAATDPDMIAAVLADTSFGNVWISRLALAAALVLVAAFAPRGSWATITFLSALVLGSLALVGHAAMQTGAEGVLHRANHAAHLLTAGAWLGGLVPFVMCLSAYDDERSPKRGRHGDDAVFLLGAVRRRGACGDGGRQYRADLRPRASAAGDAIPSFSTQSSSSSR